MRRRMLLTCVMTIALLLGGMVLAGTAHAGAATPSGTIAGSVVNGTHANTPVPGATVTLLVYVSHATTRAAQTAVSDSAGHFAFTSLDASNNATYEVTTQFQGGNYSSGLITFGAGSRQSVVLHVFDATSRTSALTVTNATMLLSPPDVLQGLIPVGVFMTFRNTSDKAFVGSVAPANGQPMGLLRFALPVGATSLTLGAGFEGVQAIQVSTGFGAAATVPPGTTQFAYVFDVPYTGTSYSLAYKAEYPTDQVAVLVPSTLSTSRVDFTTMSPVTALGQQYQLLEANRVTSGQTVTMRLTHLSLPGQQPDLNTGWLSIFAALLGLALLGLLGLFMRRGALIMLTGFGNRALGSASLTGSVSPVSVPQSTRSALLHSLLELDDARAKGQVNDRTYRARRADLRAELKSLMSVSLTDAGTPEPVTTPTAVEQDAASAVDTAVPHVGGRS